MALTPRLMKHTLYILFLLISSAAYPQLSPEVSQYYDEFKAYARAQHLNGQVTMTRDAYSRFKKICNAATNAELFALEQIADIVVREYIVKELVDRKADELSELFAKFVNDDVVQVQTADEVIDWSLAIELYEAVAYQKVKLERRKYYEKTTDKSLLTDVKQLFGPEYETLWNSSEVDSLLLKFDAVAFSNDDVAPQVLNYIYRQKEFKVGNYNRVRYFATKYPTGEILATLANFKNPNDLPILQKNFNHAFLAVAKFPHPSFLPELKKRINTCFENSEFQEAVSSYANADSRIMLDTICKKIAATYSDNAVRNEKLFSLYSIMERQNYAFYRPVLAKIDSMLN